MGAAWARRHHVPAGARRAGHRYRWLELGCSLRIHAERYEATGDASLIWEGHKAGREIGYCHIEKMHNLEALPSHGFMISCFPHKSAPPQQDGPAQSPLSKTNHQSKSEAQRARIARPSAAQLRSEFSRSDLSLKLLPFLALEMTNSQLYK